MGPGLADAFREIKHLGGKLGHDHEVRSLAPGSGFVLITALEAPTAVAAGWQRKQTENTKLSDIS